MIASHVYGAATRDFKQARSVNMEQNSGGCMAIVTLTNTDVFRDSMLRQELELELHFQFQFQLDVSKWVGTCR